MINHLFNEGSMKVRGDVLLKKYVKENYNVLEIGSAYGYFTIQSAKLSKNGTIYAVEPNSNYYENYLREKYKIEVFFKDGATEDRVVELSEEFKKLNGIRSITVISKKDAEKIFKSQFGDDILNLLGYNPLPVSCVINLKKDFKGSICYYLIF